MLSGIPARLLCANLCLFFYLAAWFNSHVVALPQNVNSTTQGRKGLDIPILARRSPGRFERRGIVSGSIGLGNNADLLYTVPVELGNAVAAMNIDTGSSDLWVVSDACQTNTCSGSSVERYPRSSLRSTGVDVNMLYGDSATGSFAQGVVGLDVATVAGVAMTDQMFGLINDTNNAIVQFGTSGIFGLGFPSGSKIQTAVVMEKSGTLSPTDDFVTSTYTDGPLLSRIAMTGAFEMPMFTITLQRSTIDISGEGLLTVGKLPDGIDNSSLTWVPVRLYDFPDGGLRPPTFAPNEIYPFRWEIDIDGVFLDGDRIPDSAIPAVGVDSKRVSALIDTGNSILRGPEDVVNNILSTVSPGFNSRSTNPVASFPCTVPHTLSFQIGGKIFPIDPRDFIGQQNQGDATTCVADNLVSTDPPAVGALFRWSLGAPFFRSNLVAFHYGNLTHPSVDPPRIGIRSNVPSNANELLMQAVANAVDNGGNFEQTLEIAPTALAATESQTTIAPSSLNPTPTSLAASMTTTYTLSLQGTTMGGPVPTSNSAVSTLGVGVPASALFLLFTLYFI